MGKWIFVGFDLCVTAYVKRWVNGDSWVLMCVTGKIRDRSKWIFVGFGDDAFRWYMVIRWWKVSHCCG